MANNKYTWANSEMWPGYPLDGDIGQEFIVPSPKLMHDQITEEQYRKIMNEINSCGDIIITSEQIKELMEHEDIRILEKMSRGDW